METLHERFYKLRDDVWKEFEKLVQTGCDIEGELSTIEYKDTLFIIKGILKDKNYSLHIGEDMIVGTSKIKVKTAIFQRNQFIEVELEVEPDISDLQTLSTYVSGGFSAYKSKN